MKLSNNQGTVISIQAQNASAVSPSDAVDLASIATLYIGGTGNVKLTTKGGHTVTFLNCQKGSTLPVLVSRVWATDTTATDLIALW